MTDQSELRIEQRHRDAAAGLFLDMQGEPLSAWDHGRANDLRSGDLDDDDFVQAFARFEARHMAPAGDADADRSTDDEDWSWLTRYSPPPEDQPDEATGALATALYDDEHTTRLSEHPEDVAHYRRRAENIRAWLQSQGYDVAALDRPVPMLLLCPRCHLQHIDAPDERTPDWDNPPHKSHLCHGCGCVWRPADVPTEGVAKVHTVGKADNWNASCIGAPDRGLADLLADVENWIAGAFAEGAYKGRGNELRQRLKAAITTLRPSLAPGTFSDASVAMAKVTGTELQPEPRWQPASPGKEPTP